ncbi:aldo/keto reductase [Actinomyces viscosus]|uniref:aldo/keto reductase n=1 Tax=Actinomyces viscosus TaxID=1656 RepID=UPI0028E28670|nr:aldo/keto reductase [Actinomyces viscosus]
MSENTPRMALGTMHFGTRLPEARSREILDAYLDLGGLWIDTANCYAFWGSETGLGGQSETVIGRWLTDRGVRDRVRISTKVGAEPTRPHGFPDAVEGLGRDTVHRAIRDSLHRLQTEQVDMYWAHMEDRTQSIPDMVATFGDLVAQGLSARIGLSNHPAWYAAAANVYAQQRGSARFSALQLRESYLHPRPDVPVAGEDHPHGMMTAESKDLAGRCDVELWAYTPLLTGAYEHPERPLPEAYEHPGTHNRLAVLRKWSGRLSMKPSQVVLALLNAQQLAITPIVGVSSVAQLSEAVQATRLTLPEEAVEELNAAG